MTALPRQELHFRGPIPSKKNRQMGNGFSISPKMKRQIDDIILFFKVQWLEPPRSRPDLAFHLHVIANRADSDNMITTLLDCLVKAGVLVNDNTMHLRSYMVQVEDSTSGALYGSVVVTGGLHLNEKKETR